MTDRFAGVEIPLMDTLRGPFDPESLLSGAFKVLFKPGSDAGDTGVAFMGFVTATQPAARINPTAINRTNGTSSFIEGSGARPYDFF
jgi:hypothetical protein